MMTISCSQIHTIAEGTQLSLALVFGYGIIHTNLQFIITHHDRLQKQVNMKKVNCGTTFRIKKTFFNKVQNKLLRKSPIINVS